ncbi:uncharacterized protein LOC18423591 isoform X2 [Amborella trichopoda]|uniref:uncharacterized protein LOC18423591 isoform X2 n=1 Tax=Amborella trichopoda TaxID=13333 RepID=UPI0009BEA4BE|nr:uncharacterized protein LOC18423591 isoform X2 [Amborella trichopoda]|eukprot:XP_020529456.1 uncharacterized protein LOC18423591 isoform X2 [Amborella trichopoda]
METQTAIIQRSFISPQKQKKIERSFEERSILILLGREKEIGLCIPFCPNKRNETMGLVEKEEVSRRCSSHNGSHCIDLSTRQKGMGGENSSITIVCLRKRLLAERAASKAAKDDLKLIEKRLKIETELRNKAQSKLKLMNRKLISVKLSVITGQAIPSRDSHPQIDPKSPSAHLCEGKENKPNSISDHLRYSETSIVTPNSVSEEASSHGDCSSSVGNSSTDNSYGHQIRSQEEEMVVSQTRERDSSNEDYSHGSILELECFDFRDVLLPLQHAKEQLSKSSNTKGCISMASHPLASVPKERIGMEGQANFQIKSS